VAQGEDTALKQGSRRGLPALILYRATRSFAFGYTSFALPLFLRFVGMTYVELGIYVLLATAASAVLSVASGFLGDLYGRKKMLLVLSLLFPLMMLILLFTESVPVLFMTAVLGISFTGGIGGGAGGGPIAPLQTSIVADLSVSSRRTEMYSYLLSVAVLSALAGSLFAAFVALYYRGFAYYHILFLTGLLFSGAGIISVLFIPHTQRNVERGQIAPSKSTYGISRIALSGIFGSLGLGLIMPFIPIWFKDIMHADLGTISLIYSFSYLATALAVYFSTPLERVLGRIRTISLLRGASSILLVLIPVSGSIAAAAVLFVSRTALYTTTVPIRQSFSMDIFEPSERARGAGITGIARRVPFGIAATMSGVLFAAGVSILAFVSAGSISMLDPVLYYYFFRKHDMPSNVVQGE